MSTRPAAGFEVEDLTPAALLDLAAANEREIREREALRLRLAYQWAILHPATEDTGVETPAGPAFDILEAPESLGGDGCPPVAAFTPETFALAIGLSPRAGGQLVGDALDLHHRLPLLDKRVARLEVPAWQARRVAQQTHHLPLAAARWVDDQLALRTDGTLGPAITDRLVAQAAARFDPETHQTEEERAEESWDLRLTHPDPTSYTGASHLDAIGDTPTLNDFHQLVCMLAHQLHRAGDTRPLGVRKITAIRIITRLAASTLTGQHALDLPDLASLGPDDLDRLGQAVNKQAGKIKLVVHLDHHDLDVTHDGDTTLAAAQIERLGAATIARLRQWVGHHAVQIQPVLNLHRRDAVDQHDPPPWMRELVILRDQHCIFPRCTTHARHCDLDHTTPYTPTDQGGPPGQTHPHGLAALCRRHHRAKTTGTWRYHHTPDGYLWHGPHNTRYLVTPEGAKRIQPTG